MTSAFWHRFRFPERISSFALTNWLLMVVASFRILNSMHELCREKRGSTQPCEFSSVMMPFSVHHLFILHYITWYTYLQCMYRRTHSSNTEQAAAAMFESCGCFCRCHRLFYSNIIANDSLQMWTIFLMLMLLLLLLLLCRFEYHFPPSALLFILAPALQKYSETSHTQWTQAEEWKKMPKCKEQKKHMLYVLSTKAPCINVNICEEFTEFFQCSSREFALGFP